MKFTYMNYAVNHIERKSELLIESLNDFVFRCDKAPL